jgi:hypothetical protein
MMFLKSPDSLTHSVFATLAISGFMKSPVAVVEIFMPRDGQTGGRSDRDFTRLSLQNLKAYKCHVLIAPLQTVFHVMNSIAFRSLFI